MTYILVENKDVESIDSVIDWYINWQHEHIKTTYFDIEIE